MNERSHIVKMDFNGFEFAPTSVFAVWLLFGNPRVLPDWRSTTDIADQIASLIILNRILVVQIPKGRDPLLGDVITIVT